ncbi:MAG: hypothetical protein KAT15_30525, partial [Bacteroidales bacterium]|nr:hypothetical protein [Bacteroidales bacterium]
AELYDTPTGQAIYEALPIHRNVNTWGDEIYFGIDVHADLEAEAKAEVAVGDLAYWPNMPAFCIFFGATPVSTGNTPVAASPVNVFGKLSDVDLVNLRRIPDGENVAVEKAG